MGLAGTFIAASAASSRGASTEALDAAYYHAAIEELRNRIGAVPGSGDILGVCEYQGYVYAWRNNSGGTAAILWRANTNGWEAVDNGHHISYANGNNAIVAGDVVTGMTSGASLVVTEVYLASGTWAGGNAVGHLHYVTHSGTFASGENLRTDRLAPTTSAATTSVQIDDSFPAGGRYETVEYNFGGHTGTFKLYGANGVGSAFIFDGTSVVPIHTGMTTDTPAHVIAHKNFLFLSFAGGSLQHSSIANPSAWSALTGASEFGIGAEITGLEKTTGGVLVIFCRNKTLVLSGSSSADWVLAEHSEVSGAIEWSIQRVASPVFLDDRGVTNLSAVQEFGNFKDDVISDLVQPILESNMVDTRCSVTVREKNQYRLFFANGYALYFTFRNNALIGTMPVTLGVNVRCAWSGEDSTGKEVIYIGDEAGYVYKLDSGTSFDGTAFVSSMRLPYHHYGSPGVNKRFLSATLELDLQDPLSTNLSLIPDFTFSDTTVPKAQPQSVDPGAGGGVYGAVNYGDCVFGGSLVGESFAQIDGHGRNMGLLLYSSSTYGRPHTIHGMTVEFANRNRRR